MSPPGTAPRLFVSDVCDTLYDSNTTTDFVRFVVMRGRRRRRLAWRAIMTRWSPLYIGGAVLYRAANLDVARALLLQLLRGMPREELAAHAERFIDEFLATREVALAQQRLADAIARGDRVMLASASIDPVIEALAGRLGVEAICSRLSYDRAGRCLGYLEADMKGNKLSPVLASQREGESLTVMTDNFSDRALIEAADERLVILRRPRDRARWRGVDAQFLTPSL